MGKKISGTRSFRYYILGDDSDFEQIESDTEIDQQIEHVARIENEETVLVEEDILNSNNDEEVDIILENENDIDFVISKDNEPEDNLNEKDEQGKIHIYKWRQKDIGPIDTSFKEPPLTPQPQPDEPPNHYFKQFVSDDMLEFINLTYSVQKYGVNLNERR